MKKNAIILSFLSVLIFTTTGVSAAVEKAFYDVPTTHWAYKAIEKGRISGLWEGYKDGNFGVDKSITRGELAVLIERNNDMLMEAFKKAGSEQITEPLASYPKTIDSWIPPVVLSYDPACLAEGAKCSDLGQAQIGFGSNVLRVKIFPNTNDSGKVDIRFFMGDEEQKIPAFTTTSYIESNPMWFNVKVWSNGSKIYLENSGGLEEYPEFFVYHNGIEPSAWQKFNPWEMVKSEFPDTIEPPFSLEVGMEHIRLTEENYCCDTSHSNNPERNTKRTVYVLKQAYDENEKPKYTIVEKGTVARK